MYCFGLKLHHVGHDGKKGCQPFPCQLVLSPVSENDLAVFNRDCVAKLARKSLYADKIYQNGPLWQ